MSVAAVITLMIVHVHQASSLTIVPNDYDLYGIKVAANDDLMVSADNVFLIWWSYFMESNETNCTVSYNETTCMFVYSTIVPIMNSSSFVYNCIDNQDNNVIGFFVNIGTCNFQLINEQIILNYPTQENFVIAIDGNGTGVYGFADDFVLFYELEPPFTIVVWSNSFNISPRALDIGLNMEYGVVVGYCQSAPSVARECGFTIILNGSLSSPILKDTINLSIDLLGFFSWSDPRVNHLITQSRTYSSQEILSVSIAWRTRLVLVGIPSLNMVLLYAFDNVSQSISTRQNGINLIGFGKSVGWLGDQGTKAAILADTYTYSSNQWISSLVYIYNIASDGFTDDTQPISIYPNSEQTVFSGMSSHLLRIVCPHPGYLTVFDALGNTGTVFTAPAENYPMTNTTTFRSISVPCIRGTRRNYTGIELCIPCPNGTFSSSCQACASNNSFCPYGSVEELSYSVFKSREQDQDYPESSGSAVFDDILMQNMLSWNTQSLHCLLLSPMTWVIIVIVFGLTAAVVVVISEDCCPNAQSKHDCVKKAFRKIDLIGEGELWIGGLFSVGVVVLITFAYNFSNGYLHQYPIENVTHNSSFACDVTIRNAKFSTTMQKMPESDRSTNQNRAMFDLLNSQTFYLQIDLVQTAFTCQDPLIVYGFINDQLFSLTISTCETSYNESILSLTVLLPVHTITVQLTLPGARTVGAIRLGLFGASAVSQDGRYTLMELNVASTYISSVLNQVLAPSPLFSLQLTSIVNQTEPLFDDRSSTYSAIWSVSFNSNIDEQFVTETQYTFFERVQTNVTITIGTNVFYISNKQEPIARQTEVIFHNFLFTIVILEMFGLVFLIFKLLIVPLYPMIANRVQRCLSKHTNRVHIDKNLSIIRIDKINSSNINRQSTIIKKVCRRRATIPFIASFDRE